MLARRLLLAGGGGSFLSAAVRDLGVAAWWANVSSPRAAYYNGKTYLTWVRDDGHLLVAEYVHATHALSTPVDLATTTAQDGIIHNNSAILVREPDHRIVVALSEQLVSGKLSTWISTNAEDATAFGSRISFGPLVVSPTWSSLAQLPDVADQPIVYIWKYNVGGSGTFRWGRYISTDGGETWGTDADILFPTSTSSTYLTAIGNGSDRIDIFTTNTNRVDAPASIYHFYMQNDNLYKSDGTLVGAATSGPYNSNAGTLVRGTSEGSCWVGDVGYDGAGNPAVLVMVNHTADTHSLARLNVWNGSTWDAHDVKDLGLRADANWFITPGAMSKVDPYRLYLPVRVGSYFEIHRFVSSDSGASWSEEAITSGSVADNLVPTTPLNAASGAEVFWGLGTYTNDANYDFTLQVYGT